MSVDRWRQREVAGAAVAPGRRPMSPPDTQYKKNSQRDTQYKKKQPALGRKIELYVESINPTLLKKLRSKVHMPRHTCLSTHAYTHLPIHTCLYTHACTYMPIHTCLYTHA